MPQTFADSARSLQAQLWESMDHRLVSGVEVLREIAERRGRDAALMPIVFTSAIGQGQTGALAERGEFRYGLSQTPQVWIDCQVVELGGGLALIWDVREAVFPDGVADAMFASMGGLLQRLAAGARAWDDRSPVPLPPDQDARRRAASASAAPLPGGLLHDAVVAQARAAPDRPAVVTPQRTLAYAELLERASVVAHALSEDGIAPGEIVGVVMDKGWEQIVGVLGILLAGGAYLPIDTNQPPLRRARLLEDAGVRRTLTQSWLRAGTEFGERFTLAVDVLPARGAPPLAPVATDPHDLAYVIYTSGSTGKPKGVAVAHRSALNTVVDVNAALRDRCRRPRPRRREPRFRPLGLRRLRPARGRRGARAPRPGARRRPVALGGARRGARRHALELRAGAAADARRVPRDRARRRAAVAAARILSAATGSR